MNAIKKYLLVIICSLSLSLVKAQSVANIDFSRITQPKVEKLLHQQELVTTADLHEVHSYCVSPADSTRFRYHEKSFVIKAKVDKVWEAYKHISPKKAWQGKIASFAFMYSRFSGKLTYQNDPFVGMEVGQIIFLNLKFMGGLFNLAVGNELTAINDEERYLQFCYLENGKSKGSQRVQLHRTPEGHTLVTHQTYYKSDSEFRDENLYPFIHGLIISEFHKSVASSLEKAGKS